MLFSAMQHTDFAKALFALVIRFHGRRFSLILFIPIRKVRPSLEQLSRKSEIFYSMRTSCAKVRKNGIINVETSREIYLV